MKNFATDQLRLAIVDDHPLTRLALRNLITSHGDWELVCECETPSELLEAMPNARPEVVVVDLCYDKESGKDLLRYLKENYAGVRTIVYSANEETEHAMQCFNLGAVGYISKQEPVTNIRKAIEAVVNDSFYISDKMDSWMADQITVVTQ